jgi:threonine dehydrogenase-like Zn-dependent dehydrogenase
MKAVEFEGTPFSMSVKTLPIPKITQPTDAVIRVTSSGICGTDLHTFHGRFPVKPPMTMGHEIVGIVHTIGSKVHDLKVGDRVIVSGIVSEDGLDGDDPEIGGLGIGDFPEFGLKQFNGGQASFVRVPFASDNLLLLPPGKEHELDYVLLSDIFPTANWALDCSGFVFGDVVVVFGAGEPLHNPMGVSCDLTNNAQVLSGCSVPIRRSFVELVKYIALTVCRNALQKLRASVPYRLTSVKGTPLLKS